MRKTRRSDVVVTPPPYSKKPKKKPVLTPENVLQAMRMATEPPKLKKPPVIPSEETPFTASGSFYKGSRTRTRMLGTALPEPLIDAVMKHLETLNANLSPEEQVSLYKWAQTCLLAAAEKFLQSQKLPKVFKKKQRGGVRRNRLKHDRVTLKKMMTSANYGRLGIPK